jgi:hypothetical protein
MKRHHQNRLQLEKKSSNQPRTTKQRGVLSKERTTIGLAIGWLTEEQSVANRFQQYFQRDIIVQLLSLISSFVF